MKVLSGFLSPDRGEILLNGNIIHLHSPAQSVALGIGMLHQDPLDFPDLLVIDNFIRLSRERVPGSESSPRPADGIRFSIRLQA
jgi:simple sugar transport system ATP-binding protein